MKHTLGLSFHPLGLYHALYIYELHLHFMIVYVLCLCCLYWIWYLWGVYVYVDYALLVWLMRKFVILILDSWVAIQVSQCWVCSSGLSSKSPDSDTRQILRLSNTGLKLQALVQGCLGQSDRSWNSYTRYIHRLRGIGFQKGTSPRVLRKAGSLTRKKRRHRKCKAVG